MKYKAADGSMWNIALDPKPIPTTAMDVDYWHEDYDGAPDSGDDRHGSVSSIEEAKRSIEEWIVDTFGDDLIVQDH